METRASYALVGAFILALMLGLAGFVVWLGKFSSDVRYSSYQVMFDGAVTGLSVDGPVRFRGIPVGTVRAIGIAPDDTDLIRVEIEIDARTPIKTDTVASIELQGITGVSYVQLSGGSRDAAPLRARPGEAMPTIASTPSALEEVFRSAPELLKSATELLNRGTALLSDDNQAAFAETLANLRDVTGEIADRRESIGAMIDDAQVTLANIRAMSDDVRMMTGELRDSVGEIQRKVETALDLFSGTLATVDGAVTATEPEVLKVLAELQDAVAAIGRVADSADAILADSRAPMRDFTESGLFELTQFIVEARSLVASLSGIAAMIERDPAAFLFGGTQAGYQAP